MMYVVENDMENDMVTFANIRELENNMSTNKTNHINKRVVVPWSIHII